MCTLYGCFKDKFCLGHSWEYLIFDTYLFQEFKEIWPKLDLILDGGVLGLTEQCRKGSTVVNLSVHGKFSIIREGR